MIRQILLPSIIIIFLTGCGVTNKLQPSQNHASSEKVLLIGAGSGASRIFMDNLSKNMISRLHKMEIESSLLFIENIKPGSQFDKTALDSLAYDAYIILYPLDNANLTMKRTTIITILHGIHPNSYKQDFLVQIYMKSDKTKPVWKGSLQVDIDLSKEENINDVSSYILNHLPLY